jgi:hypothetical protein
MGFQTNAYLNQATSPAREDPFFTIIVAAYNRPHLLAETIKSLAAQTFQDFEIVVFDNGSQPPVVVESINKPIQVIRVEKNMMLADLINPFYAKARGQWIMPFLGDDDILTRDCLEEVHHLITTTPGEIEYVGCGYTRYNRSNNTAVGKEKWDGETHVFDAKEVAYGFCAGWGIEISQATARSPCCHSSATFVFRGLLQSKALCLVKPLADVGLLHSLFQTKKAYWLCRPLVVIGEGHAKEMDGLHQSRRFLLQHYVVDDPLIPVRACTFQNLVTESHLQVLRNLSLLDLAFCLRPEFYLNHVLEILADKPRTKQTYTDCCEAIPSFWKSVLHHHGMRRHEWKLFRKVVKRLLLGPRNCSRKTIAPSAPEPVYRDIFEYEAHLSTDATSSRPSARSGNIPGALNPAK